MKKPASKRKTRPAQAAPPRAATASAPTRQVPAARRGLVAQPGGPFEFQPDAALEGRLNLRSWIPAIIGLGLVLRLIHLTRLHALPAFSELTLDPRAYDQWAQQIAAGVWVGRSAFWVDPLYAYFLGALYWL